MALIVKDRVKEVTTTTGTGTITLAGASTGFRSFADIGNANTTYYCISGGSQFEVGIGTYTASGTTLSRDTVLSNSLGTTAKIDFSAGSKDVFVTYPSDKALLGTTSAVASTGTGSVVLNSNPTFATDITVNGITVGKSIGTNTYNVAFGSNVLSANTIGINNTGIGSESLVSNTTGGVNTALGTGALYANTTGSWNTAIGGDALGSNTTGANNTSVGVSSLIFNETGSNNTAIGRNALYENTTASNNTAVGNLALTLNTTGADNTALGNQALRYNKSSSSNVAVGSNAVASPYIASGNINNVGIGNSTLTSIGTGVGTLTNLVSGSGYNDDYDGAVIPLVYQSGTPMVAGGTFPIVSLTISSGIITNATIVTNGFGFVDTTTVFTVDNASLGGVGSGFSIQIASLASANNNTALGYNAGNTNLVGSNNVYIGSGAVGTGTNQVVIGAGANAGTQDNSVQIGNTSITQTNITGLRATGAINIVGSSSETSPFNFGTSQRTNEIIIGGNAISSATSGAITLGRSTGNQTVNIANGASASGRTKTVNIGTNGASGSTTVINIGTAYTTSNPTITTLNGLIKQQTYTVVNLPAGTSGSRAFVTNALSPTFGAAVVGGGSVQVPVYHDGTSWKVG